LAKRAPNLFKLILSDPAEIVALEEEKKVTRPKVGKHRFMKRIFSNEKQLKKSFAVNQVKQLPDGSLVKMRRSVIPFSIKSSNIMISSNDKNNTCLNNGRVNQAPKLKPKTPKKARQKLAQDNTAFLI